MKIIEVKEGVELSKNCNLPILVEVVCPHCGTVSVDDYDDKYLEYPVTNQREVRVVWCLSCYEEFKYDVTLKITLEVDDNTRKL